MQPFRLGRWGSTILPLGTRQCLPLPRGFPGYKTRFQTTAQVRRSKDDTPAKPKRGRPRKGELSPRELKAQDASISVQPAQSTVHATPSLEATSKVLSTDSSDTTPLPTASPSDAQSLISKRKKPSDKLLRPTSLPKLPSPPLEKARESAKLAALHARLSLPSSLPLETLARCLIDKTADPDPRFNNHNLSVLGNDLLGYYITEHLICHYPRLPMVVLEAAVYSYVGPSALNAICHGWGVETAAEPGGEVDPGFLQFRRAMPSRQRQEITQGMKDFAEERSGTFFPRLMTLDHASASFVRSLFASIYLHTGADGLKDFFKAHILSRKLDLHSLFTFTQPTRDLSRLCARERFESPVARIISETGRLSRHPVFVVGIFSGRDKIGEDAGASLDEARFKAAAKALKGWYLYSPKNAIGGAEIMVPSMMEGEKGKGRTWRKPHIDDGEVIV